MVDAILRKNADDILDVGKAISKLEAVTREEGGAPRMKMKGANKKGRLTGGKGGDDFVFALGAGRDRINDFSVAGRDELHLDDRLWGPQVLTAAQVVAQFATVGAGEVLFDFGAVEIRLAGLTTLTGLAAQIEIF